MMISGQKRTEIDFAAVIGTRFTSASPPSRSFQNCMSSSDVTVEEKICDECRCDGTDGKSVTCDLAIISKR
jgi:hypothetical protein